MKNLKNRNNTGVSILEVCISLFIISIVIIGIFAGIQQASRCSGLLKDRIKANQIAQAKIEELKGMSYSSVSASGPDANLLLQGTTMVTVTENSEGKIVKVIVDWEKEGNGPNEELVTLIKSP